MKIIRPPVKDPQGIVKEFDKFYKSKLDGKGVGIFVSSHEIVGKLREEVRELETEVFGKGADIVDRPQRMRDELMDIAVVALHGVASIDSGKMEVD